MTEQLNKWLQRKHVASGTVEHYKKTTFGTSIVRVSPIGPVWSAGFVNHSDPTSITWLRHNIKGVGKAKRVCDNHHKKEFKQ